MNKISIFVLLILVYLGISKSFAPSKQKNIYISNERIYGNYFEGSPISVILMDAFQVGFIIKTYFHKYKIIHGFKAPEEIIVRVSKRFFERNEFNLGMSVFRRQEGSNQESIVAMYPGFLFVGDPAYGRWELQDSGSRHWKFYRAYRKFPHYFLWGKFTPSRSMQREAKRSLGSDKAFYGSNNEFGTKGTITPKLLNRYSFKSEKVSLDKIIEKHFKFSKSKKENDEGKKDE